MQAQLPTSHMHSSNYTRDASATPNLSFAQLRLYTSYKRNSQPLPNDICDRNVSSNLSCLQLQAQRAMREEGEVKRSEVNTGDLHHLHDETVGLGETRQNSDQVFSQKLATEVDRLQRILVAQKRVRQSNCVLCNNHITIMLHKHVITSCSKTKFK